MRIRLTCYRYTVSTSDGRLHRELSHNYSRTFDDMSEALLYMYKMQRELDMYEPKAVLKFSVDLLFDEKEGMR